MSRQGIQTAFNKSLKKQYKHLTVEQKKLVKIHESYEQAQKFLYGFYGFYAAAPRKSNKEIDWEKVSDRQLDFFELSNKAISKYVKQDEQKMNNALEAFNRTQFRYDQSF